MEAVEFTEEESIYLNLCSTPIRFEPVSKITNVFYDESNQQVTHKKINQLIIS